MSTIREVNNELGSYACIYHMYNKYKKKWKNSLINGGTVVLNLIFINDMAYLVIISPVHFPGGLLKDIHTNYKWRCLCNFSPLSVNHIFPTLGCKAPLPGHLIASYHISTARGNHFGLACQS